MNELALFAGAGGGILGGKLLGWTTVGAVEIEEYPRKVLLQRQKDGHLGRFPIWDDITTFDGRPWKGAVDIVSGGFPCQDISAAGKGAGIDGERSGLWGEMARVVREVSPRFVFVENSPMLTSRGLHRVLGYLAEMGYDARWCVLGADDAGAPHRRKRIWILGYSFMYGQPTTEERESFNERGNNSEAGKIEASKPERSGTAGANEEMADSDKERLQGQLQLRQGAWESRRFPLTNDGIQESQKIEHWREDPAESPTKPELGRVAHGVANRVDRLKAIGNGQVPATMALAFLTLSDGLI